MSANAAPRCIYLLPAGGAFQEECGAPAVWRRNTVTLCQAHAEMVAPRFPVVAIEGAGELDLRPRKRVVRRYVYPQRMD